MARASLLAFTILVILVGCRLPDREGLKPLPEGQVFIFPELVTRARAQASAAVEAFYVDAWLELEDVARGLEQTARFLPKSSEVPANLKTTLNADTAALQEDALKLAASAHTHDVDACNASLQRINLRIRQLRPIDPAPPAPLPPNASKETP